MKSQGRHHKPVKNELAQWLGEHIEEWKPHFPMIGVIAALLVVGAIVYLVAFSGDDNSSAPAWNEYYTAFGEPGKVEDALKSVADKHRGKPAARWALLAVADQQLRQATQELVQNPKDAKTKLKSVEATLKEAEAGASDKALLTRVHTSLAKASESAGKIDEARKYYEMVAKTDDPDGTFGKSAAKALKRLDKGSDVPELLAWLNTQELATRPKATGNPFDMMGQRREPLPERPDLSIPGEMKLDGPAPRGSGRLGPSPLDTPPVDLDLKGLPGLDKPATEAPKTETPKTETPKTGTEEPKTKKPAVPKGVKPAEKGAEPEKKAAEEKPAAEEKKPEDK